MTKPRNEKGNGLAYAFLREQVGYEGDDCILWPFARHPKGYGMLGYKGQHLRAHRFMCILVHGEPPTPKHYACHSCHNPSCINPNHLRWGTSRDNHLDQRPAGTQATSKYGWKGALTQAVADEIRALHGTDTQAAIAVRFGVSEETVRRIHNGKTYTGKKIDWNAVTRKIAETKARKRAQLA